MLMLVVLQFIFVVYVLILLKVVEEIGHFFFKSSRCLIISIDSFLN